MNFLYKIVIAALSVCLVVSLIVNFFFIKGKGINIDKSIANHNESYSSSVSGAMIVNGTFYEGNAFDIKEASFATEADAAIFMKTLVPFSWLWSKEIYVAETAKYVVKYPYFYTKTIKKNDN